MAALIPLTVACMTYVAAQTQLNATVLVGLRAVEGGQVGQVTANRNAAGEIMSRDIGPFQINDKSWVPYFTRIWRQPSERETFLLLRDNGCANALAASLIFRRLLDDSHGSYGV